MNSIHPKIDTWREKVIAAFDPDTNYFFHKTARVYDNFIDGLAWVSWQGYAASLVGDTELLDLCVRYCNTILTVGQHARTFAPHQVTADWVKSTKIEGLWYREKAQSFAGPSGWYMLRKTGAEIADPLFNTFTEASVESDARQLVRFGSLYGYAAKWFSSLRQHLNSMFIAHAIHGASIPSSLEWAMHDNPFFHWAAGKTWTDIDRMPVALIDYADEVKESKSSVTALTEASASDWVWRRDPYVAVTSHGDASEEYTPIALLTAAYLQVSLLQ